MITHALCVDIQQNRNSLVRKTPNKFLYSQQKSFSCTQKERFFEILCKIGSLGCLTKCSKGHLRIANGTYSLISQNILLSIIRYLLSFSLNKLTLYTSWSLSLINWNYIQLGTFYSYVSLTTDFLWAIKLLNVWDLAHISLLYRTVGTKTSNKSIGSIFLSLVSQLYFLD